LCTECTAPKNKDMHMNEDMNQFIGIFLQEAAEQMELLEQDILKLEHEASKELLQEIFRAAHTLKGSSRAMGLTSMGELTHAMEDIFDALRNDQIAVNVSLVDALFNGLDALKVMLQQIAATGTTALDTAVQTARLRSALGGAPAPSSTPVAATAVADVITATVEVSTDNNDAHQIHLVPGPAGIKAIQDAVGSSLSLYAARLEIAKDCVMKSVRATMLLHALARVGSVVALNPDEDALEKEAFEFSFELAIVTECDRTEILAALNGISEVSCNCLEEWPIEAYARESAERFNVVITETEKMTCQEAIAAGYRILGLRLAVTQDSVMKSVRALMTLQTLETSGSVIAIYPGEEALENEDFDRQFEVVYATQLDDTGVRELVAHINEVRLIVMEPWGDVSFGRSNNGAKANEHAADASLDTVAAQAVAVSAPGTAVPDHATGATAPAGQDKKPNIQPQTVRVDVARLDMLLNLIGELVIDRTRIAQLCSKVALELNGSGVSEQLNETAAHVGRITDQLQDEVMKARMLPIDNVFNRFPRMIRDLAQKLGKEINFVIEGRETELDRSVIEVVGDPLIHMLRNSVDHGLELPDDREKAGKSRIGTVWLRARHQENHIVIEVQDDGKGLDPEVLRANAVKKGLLTKDAAARLTDKEAINLIFGSGFSTAKEVSEVSGRGVGMDIVRSNLQKLGATIDIESKVGAGSTFIIKLPLTLAIIRGLLVMVGELVYALPLSSVVETLRVDRRDIKYVQRRPTIMLRDKTLSLARMKDLFPVSHYSNNMIMGEAVVSTAVTQDEPLYVVVVASSNRQVGIVVDSLVGEQEVVIKTLGKLIGDIRGLSGATIMGDGHMALIADVDGILQLANEERGAAYAA
jgi:two-component system chemotaxis sensor kinase CheA